MPTITDMAICVRHWDYSETSQTVCLFGREHGMIRGLAKGSRREKSRFSGGIDLLTRGTVTAIVKPNRELANLIEWDLAEIYWPLRQHLDAHRTGLFFGDMVYRMVTDHDPHPALFDALARGLDALSGRDHHYAVILRFLWALLREAGYQPELDVDAETGEPLATRETLAFSAAHGGFVADTGEVDRWRVRVETVAALRAASGADDASAPAARRASRLLAAYLRHILDDEPETMRLVFPDLPRG